MEEKNISSLKKYKYFIAGVVLLFLIIALIRDKTQEIIEINPSEVAYEINTFAVENDDSSQKFDNTIEDWSKVKSSSKMIIVPYKRIQTGALPFINSKNISEKKIIVVSQEVISKKWVADKTNRPSSKDGSFIVESANGAEFNIEIILSAKVSNTDAYLSVYGIEYNSDLKDVKIYSKSLDKVLEDTVKPFVHQALSEEFLKYETFDIQGKKIEIIKKAWATIQERFEKDGIDILTFTSSGTIIWEDRRIQESINERARLEAQFQQNILEAKVRAQEAEAKTKNMKWKD